MFHNLTILRMSEDRHSNSSSKCDTWRIRRRQWQWSQVILAFIDSIHLLSSAATFSLPQASRNLWNPLWKGGGGSLDQEWRFVVAVERDVWSPILAAYRPTQSSSRSGQFVSLLKSAQIGIYPGIIPYPQTRFGPFLQPSLLLMIWLNQISNVNIYRFIGPFTYYAI